MIEAGIHERVSGIRGEVLELITMIPEPGKVRDLPEDLMLDDLLVVANRLGRVAETLDQRAIGLVRSVAHRIQP